MMEEGYELWEQLEKEAGVKLYRCVSVCAPVYQVHLDYTYMNHTIYHLVYSIHSEKEPVQGHQ